MAPKVFVTPRSFGKHNRAPITLLQAHGFEVELNPYGRILSKDEMIRHLSGAEAVIVGVDPLDQEVMQQASQLKMISKYGVGTDNIDTRYAAERGIKVTVTANANTEAVADYAFALILASARKVLEIDKGCRERNWSKITTVDVYGKTLGLLGLGNIGKAVVKRAKGFDMKLLAYDLFRDERFASEHGISYTDHIHEVLREADFVSLHLPLNSDTHHIVGANELDLMKPTAVLINTARGGLIDEKALLSALRDKKIWGAGIDVFEQEPPAEDGLLKLENLIIGSHCAASTLNAIDNMGTMASENIIKYLLEVQP